MKFALNMPNMGAFADGRLLAELAVEAEAAGWDGFFVWDSIAIDPEMLDEGNREMCDPWLALALVADRTERMRIGPIITPLSRRRPWKVARETTTLDHLSHGRVTLPTGLGSLEDGGFKRVNEITDRRQRAQRLDEALAILDGLWSGEPFSFEGEHYQIDGLTLLPRPVQRPRIPIWPVVAWPRPRSMARGLDREGVMPVFMTKDGEIRAIAPDELAEMCTYLAAQRPGKPFDVIIEAETPGDDPEAAAAIVRPFAAAGATWWMESIWWHFYRHPGEVEPLRRRIWQGPPQIS